MPRRNTRKEGDPCPKCFKSMSGGNLLLVGPTRSQAVCAACHDSYHRSYMADVRRWPLAIEYGLKVADIRKHVAADPEWYDKYVRKETRKDAFDRAWGNAKREIEAGCTPERKAALQAEFNGKTAETWRDGR